MFEDMKSKRTRLAKSIIEKTARGKLMWNSTSESDTFQSRIGDNVIIFFSSENIRNSELDYNISILNSVGEIIDHFSDGDLESSNEMDFYILMDEMMSFIKRIDAGTDEVFDEILAELEGD